MGRYQVQLSHSGRGCRTLEQEPGCCRHTWNQCKLLNQTKSWYKVWSVSAFKIYFSLFLLGSELLSDLQHRHSRTSQFRTYLGTNIPYKIRIIKSSWISYSSSKWICSILGNWYTVKTLAKNPKALPAASPVQEVECCPLMSRFMSHLHCCHITVLDYFTPHSSICF